MRYLRSFIFILTISLIAGDSLAFSLDSAFVRSDSCVHIQWVPDNSNTDPLWYVTNGIMCTGLDSVYRHCDFLPGQSYSGVAYSYGGEDSWYLFRSRLMQGYLAGSHLCHYSYYGDPSNRVTGTDCSGFLSFLWNYPRVSTRIFANSSDFFSISFSEIRPGDAIVKSGSHIVFVLEADTITEVVISEASSTVRGCRERLVNLTDPEWAQYKAIRYPKINPEHVKSRTSQLIYNKYSIKNAANGYHIIRFYKQFSGSLRVLSLDGKLMLCTSVRSSKTVPFKTMGKSVVIIHLKDEKGNFEVNKVPLCR